MHDLNTATAALQRARRSLRFTQEQVTATEGRTLDYETASDCQRALGNALRDLDAIADALTCPPVLTFALTPCYPFEQKGGAING